MQSGIFKHKKEVKIRWSDIDSFNHVNNAVYLTYFEEARVRYFADICQWDWTTDGLILAKIEIDYIIPLIYSQKPVIYTRCSRLGTKSFDLDYEIYHELGSEKTLISKGKSVLVCFDYQKQESIRIPEVTREKLIAFDSPTC